MDTALIKKYNVPGPRYTSYPTVPYWDKKPPSKAQWKELVKRSFDESNEENGISLYIHLPFCESLCTYCGCNTRITVNHKVEERYIGALLKEWSIYLDLFKKKPRIREIHLGGGTPTFFSASNLCKLIEGIRSTSEVCKEYEFGLEAHPNSTSKEHLQTLYALGFKRLSLGIQDFDPKVQEIVNRIQLFEKVKEVTDTARRIGYTSVNYDLIYGLPLQTLHSVKKTIEKVKLLRPDRIAFYSYAHVPWIKPGQRKFTEKDLPIDEEKRALYEVGKRMLTQAGYMEIGMDHFALPGDILYKAAQEQTLHRNFMGYTPSYTQMLIGIGVSSISDAWYAFMQNAKTVEAYYALLEKNELPVFKGHALTNDDLVMRRHILNIMCRFETSWKKESDQVPDLYQGLERLKEMEHDKLISLAQNYLKVEESGKPFIRNVCMALDAHLWHNVPKTQLFSSVI